MSPESVQPSVLPTANVSSMAPAMANSFTPEPPKAMDCTDDLGNAVGKVGWFESASVAFIASKWENTHDSCVKVVNGSENDA